MDHNDDYDSNFSTLNMPTSLYSPSNTSPPTTETASSDMTTETRLYRARVILENRLYDEINNRYKLATKHLHDLQEENEWLRLTNEDLNRRLNRLLSSSIDPIISGNSPTSVINDNEERFTLPKSISVRSPGYFKFMNSAPCTPTSTASPLVATSNMSIRPSQDINGTRLRLRDQEKAIEMDVYNQGMYKTELCNKWQETNTCPYNEHCRFAHGVSELRPVIRHPRYKTQVCRMVLNGVTCPYGHRCHFRHSI